MSNLLDSIILGELRSFITNTNNLYSINNGPFPNTALQYSTFLLAKLAEKRKREQMKENCIYDHYIQQNHDTFIFSTRGKNFNV
jgi:hypothetical protein